MSVEITSKCDRCGHTQKKEKGPNLLPLGWSSIKNKDLCKTCGDALNEFLKPLPQAAVTTTAAPVVTIPTAAPIQG